MSTTIRPELSKDNKYYISKHRYYELKHFCLQYDEWKRMLAFNTYYRSPKFDVCKKSPEFIDPTCDKALYRTRLSMKIRAVETAAKEADKDLAPFILLAVTKGYSYEHMSAKEGIPCGKDMYYDRYRKFFYELDQIV